MTSELDVYRTAKLLNDRYGDGASLHAADPSSGDPSSMRPPDENHQEDRITLRVLSQGDFIKGIDRLRTPAACGVNQPG